MIVAIDLVSLGVQYFRQKQHSDSNHVMYDLIPTCVNGQI